MFRSTHSKLLTGVSAIGLGLILTGPAAAADPEDPIVHTLSGHAEIYGGYSWLNGSALGSVEIQDSQIG